MIQRLNPIIFSCTIIFLNLKLKKVCARSTVNRLGGLRLPRKSVAGLTDRPDMTIDFTVDVNHLHNLKEKASTGY